MSPRTLSVPALPLRVCARLAFLLLLATAAGCSKKGVTHPVDSGPVFAGWGSLSGPSNANVRALVTPGGGSVILVAGTDSGIWRVDAVAGSAWKKVDGAAVNCMTVDGAGFLYAGTPLGVLRSTDAGANWSDFSTGIVSGTGIVSMAVGSAGIFAATATGGVIAWTSGADHWVDASGGLGPEVVTALGVRSGSLIAGTQSGDEFVFNAGLWQTSTNPASGHPVLAVYSPGGTWMYTGTRDFGIYVNGTSAGLPANTSAYSFIHANVDYAGTNHHVYLSANAGGSWTQAVTAVSDGTPITSFASVGGFVYAGTAGFGVMHSSTGAVWSSFGPADARVNALFESAGGKLLAGTDRGIQYSNDGGAHWSVSTFDSGAIACLAAQGTTLYAGTLGNGIARSTDGGATWTDASVGLPAGSGVFRIVSDGTALIANLLADPTGLYRSVDGGDTWSPLASLTNHQNVTDLTVRGGLIFAGEFGTTGGVFVSANHGSSWAAANGGVLGGKTVTALGAGGSVVYAATTDGIWWSDDDGASWHTALAPAVIAKQIAVHNDDVAVVATDGTVLRTRDDGLHWDRQTPAAQVLSVAAGATSFVLGTDAGVWRSPY